MTASVVRRAFSYLRPYRGRFWFGQVTTLVATATGLVFPMVSKYLIDSLLDSAGVRSILPYVGAIAASFALLAVFTWLKERTLGSLSHFLVRDLRRAVFDKLQLLPIGYFERTGSGQILSVLTNDINLFHESISRGLIFVINQLVSLVAIVGILVWLDPILTAVLLGVVPAAVIITQLVSKRARIVSREAQRLLGAATSIAGEVIRGIDVVKSFVLSKHATQLFGTENTRATDAAVRQVRLRAASSGITTMLSGIAIVVLVGVGSAHVVAGQMTPGDLVAYLIYAQLVVGPVGMLTGIYVEIQRAFAAVERVFDVLDAENEPGALPPPEATESPSTAGAGVELQDVRFSYPSSEPAVHGVSINVPAGGSCALVGPSGAGKSTLMKLLLRFYDPDAGAILLDGVDISTLPVDEVRHRMAIVMQDTHLFDMSVCDNIRCGLPTASDEEVEHAARSAYAHEFIETLPDGYATQIGENGCRLSGGQRQRIAIARAFLKDPSVLLLDEATSSLDTESEREIQRALADLMRGRTTIAIAHRLSTVQHMDTIVVLDRGAVQAAGSHADLLESNELYRTLCRHQMIQSA
jgi:ABC-type multidrug transport system fused ATPase/permease subunit